MASRATTKISHTSRDFLSTCRAGALSSLGGPPATKLSKVGEDVPETTFRGTIYWQQARNWEYFTAG